MFIHLLQLLVTKLDTFSLAHTLNGGYLLNPELMFYNYLNN